jgi:small subunit ribosomal protein S20
MANTKQAKKRAAQADRRQDRNRAIRTRTRNVVRTIRKTAEGDAAGAAQMLPSTQSTIDVAVRKGVVHKRTAARLKSRVAKTVAKAGGAKS